MADSSESNPHRLSRGLVAAAGCGSAGRSINSRRRWSPPPPPPPRMQRRLRARRPPVPYLPPWMSSGRPAGRCDRSPIERGRQCDLRVELKSSTSLREGEPAAERIALFVSEQVDSSAALWAGRVAGGGLRTRRRQAGRPVCASLALARTASLEDAALAALKSRLASSSLPVCQPTRRTVGRSVGGSASLPAHLSIAMRLRLSAKI